MQFNLNEMQTMIQDGARRLLDETFDSDAKRDAEASEHGFSTAIWSQMSELGWAGAALPEAVGGGGLGMLDLCIIAEEFGRAAVCVPLAVSSGFSANMLQNAEQTDFATGLLGQLATGEAIVTPALIDEGARDERSTPKARIESNGADGVLSGSKIMVPYASAAQLLLVSAIDDNAELVIVAIDGDADGVSHERHVTTGAHPLFNVKLDQVAVSVERILARGETAQKILDRSLDVASILSTAEAVGNCEGMLLLSAEYATNREQFGTRIGSFQAVSHPLADMRIQIDAIRLLVYETAWMFDEGKDVVLEVSETKALANEAVVKMLHSGHTVHGAIGYTMEYDLQLFTRRARAYCLTFGDTQSQTERAAVALGL